MIVPGPVSGAADRLESGAFGEGLEVLGFQDNVLYLHGDDCLNGRFCREFSGVQVCF